MSSPNGRFDLNAKRREREAAAAEAADERWSFTFGVPPETFSFAPQKQWPGEGKRLLDRGDLHLLIDRIVDKPGEFWACSPTIADLEDLLDAYGEWAGVGDLGESDASPPPASTLTSKQPSSPRSGSTSSTRRRR